MGNQILGKRSRNYYKGFNDKQIDYIKEKFSVMSKGDYLDIDKFTEEYKLDSKLALSFCQWADFDRQQSDTSKKDKSEYKIDEYEWICVVNMICNMTISQLASKLFDLCLIDQKKSNDLKNADLERFTSVCLNYNYALENKSITPEEIKKINKAKFTKYDFDKSKSISKEEFIKLCTKDEDYKKWMFNMGFITKNQMELNDQIYDLVDSDVDEEIQRHLKKTDIKMDLAKRGVEHKMKKDQDEFQVEEEEGDQCLPPGEGQEPKQPEQNQQQEEQATGPKKPWQESLQKIKYPLYNKLKQNPNLPSQNLIIKHIFGYRSYDCRNNIKFTSKGNIAYHMGSVGIIMNQRNQQFYMTGHKDDIVCLDMYDDMVVTGQMGSEPAVIFWRANAQKSIKSELIVTEDLKESIGNVAISPEGDFLAVNCNDNDHKLFVYDISSLTGKKKKAQQPEAKLKGKGKLSQHAILDLKFTPDSKLVVAASLKQILFVKYEGATMNASRGEFGQFSNSCALCLLPLKTTYKNAKCNWMLSGMTNGSIYFWDGDKCIKAVSGHTGSVSALCATGNKDKQTFVSGDKTGKIIVWGQNFQQLYKCTILKNEINANMIISLSILDNKEILVGTKSSTVYRAKLIKDLILKPQHAIISGHHEGNLHGLAVDQNCNNVFFTGGQDQRLMKWQYKINTVNPKILKKKQQQKKGVTYQNKLLLDVKLKYKIRSLSLNSAKNVLAVGYFNGIIELFDLELKPLNVKYEHKKSPDREVLSLIKWNSEGNILLACYAEATGKSAQSTQTKYCIKVIPFAGNKFGKQKQIISSTKVTAVDFDQKSKFIRFNNQGLQYKVFDIKSDKATQLAKRTDFKQFDQFDWQTHTTILSPQTVSFKTKSVTETDVVCCERLHEAGNVLLVGDKYSKIKLFNFPCINFPIFNKFQGHSNSVTAMQFDGEDQCLISIGGEEKSIIVWDYEPDEVNNEQFFKEMLQERKRLREQRQKQNEIQKATGEQKPACLPYLGQIKQPSDFKTKYNAKRDNKVPKQNLKIQHVFGIRNQYIKDEVRNMCRFSKNLDHILFPTACLGVKMNIQTKQQTYCHEHKQDIVSFAVDRSRTLMATGQMAEKNIKDPRKKIVCVCVWDTQKNKLLKKLDGFHTIAVVLLEFSPSGKLLFSVGNDAKNSYAVYDWKAGTVLHSGPISGGKVNGIAWKNQSQFMTCGVDHVKLWQGSKGKQGKFSHGKFQSMISCAYSQKKNLYITGSAKNTIFLWSGTQTVSENLIQKGNKQNIKIQTILVKGEDIYSGSANGNIVRWMIRDNKLQQIQNFSSRDMLSYNKIDIKDDDQFGILSIDIAKEKQLLIVTQGAFVIYCRTKDEPKIIHQGHYKGELWGLATSAVDGNYVVTGGDDKTVRIWDLKKKCQRKRLYLKNMCRAVDVNGNDKKIVAGDSRARLYLMDAELESVKQYTGLPFSKNQKSKEDPWIEDIKFSPNGGKVCYGTHGKSLDFEIVDIEQNKFSKKVKAINGGSSAINHIDWSKNGDTVAINTQGWQLLFFNTEGGAPSASSLKDQKWATYTRKYGFQSKGIFQDVDHTNINTICRDPTGTMLAVGYDDQTIRVFRYPCFVEHQVFKQYFGHSSHVTKIKFTNSRMISIGGLDRTIIVWKIEGRENFEEEKPVKEEDDDGLDDLEDDVDLPMKAVTRKKPKVQIQDFTVQENEGDEFMAVKPWVGAIKEPTYKYPKSTGTAPNVGLELQHVFGYRSKDCRQNLFYTQRGTILYHAAGVLIDHNISQNKQTLFTQHNDDILSIDYNKSNDLVVTGEIGPKPLLCIYRNGKYINQVKSPVTKGIMAVGISSDGRYAACAGMDDKHQIAVVDLKSCKVLAKVQGSRKVITKLKWKNNSEFVTIGICHFCTWTFKDKISKGREMSDKVTLVSIDCSQKDGLLLVGGGNSSLYDFSKASSPSQALLKESWRNATEQDQKNIGVVQSIKITKDFIVCGTKSGSLIFLDPKTKQNIGMINLKDVMESKDKQEKQIVPEHLRSENTCVRAIDVQDNKILFGTLGGQIYEVEYQKEGKVVTLVNETLKNIAKGHFAPNNQWTNQVWGLCIPQHVQTVNSKQFLDINDCMFTCSDDSTIRVWSLSQRKIVYCRNQMTPQDLSQLKNKDYPHDRKFRAIAVSPNGKYVAVGAFDGTVRVYRFFPQLDNIRLQLKKTFKHAKQWISDIKFGFKTLIVGSHDNGIYVYQMQDANDVEDEKGSEQDNSEPKIKIKYKPMKKHSSYITHIDVSRDNCFLQSTCGAYELLFWDINSGKQVTSGASMLKDQMWKTWTCNLGWPVQGIYPKQQDGTFINSVDRSKATVNGNTKYDPSVKNDFFLLTVGNDHGKVCVYNYPSLVKNSEFVQGKGHSSHVTNVRWMKNDEHIISVGGEDQCVMVWKVEKGKGKPKMQEQRFKKKK